MPLSPSRRAVSFCRLAVFRAGAPAFFWGYERPSFFCLALCSTPGLRRRSAGEGTEEERRHRDIGTSAHQHSLRVMEDFFRALSSDRRPNGSTQPEELLYPQFTKLSRFFIQFYHLPGSSRHRTCDSNPNLAPSPPWILLGPVLFRMRFLWAFDSTTCLRCRFGSCGPSRTGRFPRSRPPSPVTSRGLTCSVPNRGLSWF